jgi:APA family basic amino acid/polyamine antiporter
MRQLARTLGVLDLTLLAVGTVIGSGIFLVPGGGRVVAVGMIGVIAAINLRGTRASSAWAAILAASGTFEQLLTYVVFAGWAFYALGGLSLFYYRRQRPDLPRPFKVPGYPWTPWLFVLSAVGIVVNTLITQPGRAFVGVAVVLAGVPAFWRWRRNAVSGGG